MERIYVVPGLIDFRMRMKAGKTCVTVDFTGGRTGGEVPRWASFATGNEVMQRLIEQSVEFRTGKIRRQR